LSKAKPAAQPWIRIGNPPKTLDPDPDEMNADPQPWSQVCVEAMGNCDCVAPLHRAMKLRKDLLATSAETFNRSSYSFVQVMLSEIRDRFLGSVVNLWNRIAVFPDPDPIFQINLDLNPAPDRP
jgi:hypothetical protein